TILGGRPFAEDQLLAVAAAYQAVTDWHLRRPANPAGEAPPPTSVDPAKSRRLFPGSARGKVLPAPVPAGRGRLEA
ncbi:MAG: amidase, partial [Actinomycetes bacterium]